ncbi:MAG: hypothetical protein ACXWCZ_10735 [Flavisolibacter sp.]
MKVAEPTGAVLFEEKQYFPRWLLVMMLSPILITVGITMVMSIRNSDKSEMWIALAIAVPIQLIMLYLFFNVQLEKLVTKDGLYYRWTIIQKKFRVITKAEIEKIELRKPPSLGYGKKYTLSHGKVHNLSDKEGLQLYLKNGKKVFFGTAETFSFNQAMTQ